MSMMGTAQPTEYTDGITKQSFKDETDVNAIVQKHTRMGTLSHLEQWGGEYGDWGDFNFQDAQNQIARANSMFEQLPSAVRNQFSNSPEKFLEFVNDPDNKDQLAKKLPQLAAPGSKPIPTNKDKEDPEPTPKATEKPAEPAKTKTDPEAKA